jgi:hypothetical protein
MLELLMWPIKLSVKDVKFLKMAVLAVGAYRCFYCGSEAEHVDHIVPQSKGGTNAPRNLISACGTCNIVKGHRRLPASVEKAAWTEAYLNEDLVFTLMDSMKYANDRALRRRLMIVREGQLAGPAIPTDPT